MDSIKDFMLVELEKIDNDIIDTTNKLNQAKLDMKRNNEYFKKKVKEYRAVLDSDPSLCQADKDMAVLSYCDSFDTDDYDYIDMFEKRLEYYRNMQKVYTMAMSYYKSKCSEN